MSTAIDIRPEDVVFRKTELGKETIARRSRGLSTHLRTLLLLIDGKQSVAELLESLSDMNYELHHFLQLARDGYVIDSMNMIDPSAIQALTGKLDDTVEVTANTEAMLEGALDETRFDWDAPLDDGAPDPEPDPAPGRKKLYPW